MGIVNELQGSAESEDVLTVLRKAKRVASKLDRRDISEWLDHEQNGYPHVSDLPNYRQISTTFAYKTHGYIPVGYGLLKNGIENFGGMGLHLRQPILDAIGTVMDWIAKDRPLYAGVSGDIVGILRKAFYESGSTSSTLDQLTFLVELNPSQIGDIPNQVKNKILDWALSLESAGITGDDHSFSATEKQIAQHMTFILDQSTNKTQVETMQGAMQINSPNATLHAKVSINADVADAIQKIASLVDSSNELDDLDKQDIRASLNFIRELASKDSTPKVKMKLNEKLAALASGVEIASKIAPHIQPLLHVIRAKLGL